MLQLLSPSENETITLQKPEHLDYIREPKNTAVADVDWLRLKETQQDLSSPNPVRFRFSPAIDATVLLYHPNGDVTRHPAVGGAVDVFNLQIGTTYYWQVEAGDDRSARACFHTADIAPRLLNIEGITNVRDFGGFTTKDGKKIRQGLLYRSSEMDTHVNITQTGKQALKALHIRTDLDIRGCHDEYRAPNLESSLTEWVNIPLVAYEKIFTDKAYMAAYGKAYALLTDATRFPMIVHCWGGIDRTGCWLFILGGMLGVHEDQLFLDYEFSSFCKWGQRSRHSDQFSAFLAQLMTLGDTVEVACRHFMLAAGLTSEQIEQIKNIFIEK
ncbi:MAG: tyrosine-protein phosphatase [Ruminococcaceae bacterium]|nr:tyrosine-protein phosphatase [Oscillospiraceae bacterium]